MDRTKSQIKHPLQMKLLALVAVAAGPLLLMTVYLILSLISYRNAYDSIVSNMTIANSYNLNFKEDMDESLYKLAVGSASFALADESGSIEDPYALMDDLRDEFEYLATITGDRESLEWIQSLLRNIDTLEDRVDDLTDNLDHEGSYEENMLMLDNNIYILTELIQDDIQYYIYYQTKSIEMLKTLLDGRIRTFFITTVIILGFILILVLSVSTIIQRSITRPIEDLCEATERIADGDFATRVSVDTHDEILNLAQSVNNMSEHLEVLVSKIKDDERKMRHAELRLLQEQINPHFLYNTLDTIVWLIESNDSDRAVSMVISLSDFFRMVLSKGKEFITIREEERHIKSYLEIQQVRYRDILDFEINIDPEIYDYSILKLTLQPIVENSLYHGIKYKRAKGIIRVTGSKVDDNLILTVMDTGVGMDEQQLKKLRDEVKRPCKDTTSGFGLANVNERIRMNYGTEYGMTIDSVLGEGTTVSIMIPAQIGFSAGVNADEK